MLTDAKPTLFARSLAKRSPELGPFSEFLRKEGRGKEGKEVGKEALQQLEKEAAQATACPCYQPQQQA